MANYPSKSHFQLPLYSNQDHVSGYRFIEEEPQPFEGQLADVRQSVQDTTRSVAVGSFHNKLDILKNQGLVKKNYEINFLMEKKELN